MGKNSAKENSYCPIKCSTPSPPICFYYLLRVPGFALKPLTRKQHSFYRSLVADFFSYNSRRAFVASCISSLSHPKRLLIFEDIDIYASFTCWDLKYAFKTIFFQRTNQTAFLRFRILRIPREIGRY